MNFEVIAIPRFKRDLKKLSKKYTSLKTEFANLIAVLEHKPEQGVTLGNNCFKIRLAIASKSKGKSGGARVIICVKVSETTVYLLTIYDKNEKENISNRELLDLLKENRVATNHRFFKYYFNTNQTKHASYRPGFR